MWRASPQVSCRNSTRSARNFAELADRLRASRRSASGLPSVHAIRRAARLAATADRPAAPHPSSSTVAPAVERQQGLSHY